MANIYLVRHGESVANTKGIYQGQTYNTPLSVMGKKQVTALAGYFENIEIAKILASPLIRTRQTAKKVADVKQLEIIESREIIETNHGEWEGLEKKVILEKWPVLYQLWLDKPSKVKFPKGETFVETRTRVITWWGNIIKGDDNVLIVTHDNIIRIILSEVMNEHLDNIWKFKLHPAAVTTVEVTDGVQKLLKLNDKRHLKHLIVDIGNHAL